MDLNNIYNKDALEGLKQLDESSIDAIISDPPYQLSSMTKQRTDLIAIEGNDGNGNPFCRPQAKTGFMNKDWDVLPSVDILKECLRVLKSGSWALWLMTPRQDSQLEFMLRLRQAGFNISFSSIEWVYASGFPKAADLSLLADKRACKEDLIQKLNREPTTEEFNKAWDKWREKVAVNPNSRPNAEKSLMDLGWTGEGNIAYETNPHIQEAQTLSGSYAGMQLKPARELIIVSQKPIIGKTYLDQALLHLKEPEHNQIGGTWLDDARIPYKDEKDRIEGQSARKSLTVDTLFPIGGYDRSGRSQIMGRFPANIIVSDNALDIGANKKSTKINSTGGFGAGVNTFGAGVVDYERGYEDSGDLSRYFDLDFWFSNKIKELPKEQQKIFSLLYVPKASKSERNKGLEHLPEKNQDTVGNQTNKETADKFGAERKAKMQNIHPTCKPIKLLSYLITLTTRENDIVLDPFIGSGTTAISSILLKRKFIGFEREKEYYDIAAERIKHYQKQKVL